MAPLVAFLMSRTLCELPPDRVVPQQNRDNRGLHPQVLLHEHLHVHVVEAVLDWRKSSASNPSGNCVEIAVLPGGDVAVRNSRHPTGPTIVYTRAEMAAFICGIRSGEFDDLAE